MKEKLKKQSTKNVLYKDIKEINIILIVIIAIFIISMSSLTSYALFNYEETSPFTIKAVVGKLTSPTPEYCFEYVTSGENAAITNYLCYEGNSNGYETITDVVIPETIEGYTVKVISDSSDLEGLAYNENFNNNLTLLNDNNDNYTIVPIKEEPTAKTYPFASKNLTSIVIPDSVTRIGRSAFYNNNLASLTIPDSVTTIEYGAFSNNNLTSVIIPDSITSIGEKAFYYNNLTNVTIGKSVTTIGESAFAYNNLTSVIISDSVTTIGDSAFRYNNITNIVVDGLNKVYDSRNDSNAIIETETNTLVQGCINTIIPYSVTTIGDYAFHSINLTSLTIPNSVTTIGDYAFHSINLTSLTIPNSVTTIGENAFSVNNLTSLTIPDSVTTIGGSAFAYNNLTSVTIPSSVTTIGSAAFAYNNLNNVVIVANSNLTAATGIELGAFHSSSRTSTRTLNDGTTITYVDNPNLTKIYNNSGKAFAWIHAVNGSDSTTTFITGTVPSYTTSTGYTYNEVLVTTGTPE